MPQTADVPASARGALVAALGAVGAPPSFGTYACLRREFSGEPDAGNLHLRFDEGRVGRAFRVALSPTLPALLAGASPNADSEPRPKGAVCATRAWLPGLLGNGSEYRRRMRCPCTMLRRFSGAGPASSAEPHRLHWSGTRS